MAISRSVDGTPSTVTASAVRVAVLCGLVQMLDGYDLSAVGLAAPAIIKAWGVKPVELTAAFAFSSIGIMVGAMSAGPIADRFGRKPVLLASVALFGIFSLLTVWAPSILALVVMRFFTGIGIGGAMPTTVALTSDYTSDRWRASAVMFMFTGNTVGGFFAGQIAAVILPGWGWQGIFVVGGVVPLVLLVLLFFVLPESRSSSRASRPSRPIRWRACSATVWPSSTLLLWAIFLINLLNMYLIGYWLPTTLTLGGLTPSSAAFAASIYAAGAIVSTLVLGPTIAHFGAGRVLAISFVVGAISIGIVGSIPCPMAGRSRARGRGRRLHRQPARPERLRRRDLSHRGPLDRHRLGAGRRPAGRHPRPGASAAAARHRIAAARRAAVRVGPGAGHGRLVVWLGFVSRGALARSSTLARSFD